MARERLKEPSFRLQEKLQQLAEKAEAMATLLAGFRHELASLREALGEGVDDELALPWLFGNC